MLGVEHSRLAGRKDAKTELQELLQGRQLDLPRYRVVDTIGHAHEQQFKVACDMPELQLTTLGTGNSRRHAEQVAASKALQELKEKGRLG